jgi:hypothetical protein
MRILRPLNKDIGENLNMRYLKDKIDYVISVEFHVLFKSIYKSL